MPPRVSGTGTVLDVVRRLYESEHQTLRSLVQLDELQFRRRRAYDIHGPLGVEESQSPMGLALSARAHHCPGTLKPRVTGDVGTDSHRLHVYLG